jgi:uncharacterized protein
LPTHGWEESVGAGPERFLQVLTDNSIDEAWVFPSAGLSDPDPSHNDSVSRFCEEDPSRLRPFCTVHPHLPGAIAELRRCVFELGACGLKLHPWLQGFSATDSCLDELGEVVSELHIPIVFHDGTPPGSSPLQVAYFAERYPQVAVILGHGGLHDLWEEAVIAAERTPNLRVIPSGTPPGRLREVIKRVGADRVLFGSDAGYSEPRWQRFQLDKMAHAGLDDQRRALVMGGNATKIVSQRSEGLEHGP